MYPAPRHTTAPAHPRPRAGRPAKLAGRAGGSIGGRVIERGGLIETAAPRLVLWDIDGTLVQAGQVGRDIFSEAFRAVIGREPDEAAARMLAMAGRTDQEIALELLAAHEIADGDSHLPAFTEALVAALAAKAAVVRERGRALPGAEAALAALDDVPGVVQSLLTGNVEANALLKLATFGLDRYLDFEVGGFGSDHRHRPSLVGVARDRAERKYGRRFDGPATVLVGDTPLDVAAGRAGGARVVAVASGPYRTDELAAAGADAVLPDLGDGGAVLDAVLGGPASSGSAPR